MKKSVPSTWQGDPRWLVQMMGGKKGGLGQAGS